MGRTVWPLIPPALPKKGGATAVMLLCPHRVALPQKVLIFTRVQGAMRPSKSVRLISQFTLGEPLILAGFVYRSEVGGRVKTDISV